jgi:hypothetical protein
VCKFLSINIIVVQLDLLLLLLIRSTTSLYIYETTLSSTLRLLCMTGGLQLDLGTFGIIHQLGIDTFFLHEKTRAFFVPTRLSLNP